MATPITNGIQNGTTTVTNGHTTSNKVHTATSESYNETRTSRTEKHGFESTKKFSSEQQITVLRQTVTTTRAKFICDLSNVNDYIDSMTMENFLEYIESERLTNMPQRGSRWDKVLKWAEFFALQISGYETALGSFVPHSKSAAQLIWASCRVLIELGPSNSQAIETAFAVLYKVGLSLSFFLQHRDLLSSTSSIRTQAGESFNDLLMLVRDITIHYHIQINTILSNEVSLDFNGLFGRAIDNFYARKDRIIEAMWASKIDDDSININAIQKWLSIRDATTRTYLGDRAAAKARRDEYTCDWFQRSLLDFTRGHDDVLAVTGPSGSGKSMLSGWILERLQRPIGKKTYETLSLSIDIEIPEECNSFAVAKGLALQLLRSNIGDVALLGRLSDVYQQSIGWTDNATLENGLWNAIHVGLANSGGDNKIILVDGLDERCGHDTAMKISNRIAEITSKHKNAQAIILTRNATYFTKKVHVLSITPDHTHFDLQHIADHALQGCQHYLNQNDHEREAVVEKLTHAAKGNFLWVQLMAKFLKQETSHDGFMKSVKAAHESPKSVEHLMKTLITTVTGDFANTNSVHLLSWLLVSQRPLTTREIRGLLQVDIQKKALLTRNSDIEEDIRALGGPLIRIQNGIVRFRHGAFREQLLKISTEGKKLRNFSVLQSDFTARLLAYCKFRLTSPYAVCFDHPEVESNSFLHDALLEYASRKWIYHFKKSTHYKPNGSLELHLDFKALFPTTVQLAVIEWSCWESQSSGFEAVTLHDLAHRVRQEVLTDKHECIIQTLITCGHLHRKLKQVEQAGSCFYRASRIGQSILKAYSSITLSCTTAFLEIAQSVVCKTRTEFVTHREESLQYVITVFTHQHGKASDIVIKYHRQLAELYVCIHEEEKAETCWKELREIMVIRYGEGSSEEASVCGHHKIVIKKGESREEVIEYERDIFDTTCEMEIWDTRRIEVTLKMAITYESHRHLLKAEECYIMLWSGLIEYCHQINKHHHVDIEIHISMIDISLEYVKFLRRHNRHEEAAGVLICIWAEYEEYDFESEVIFLRLKVIGELMRSVSLLSIAVSVFKKCWSWFKSHEKHEFTSSCQILISETIEEIITIETKSVNTTTTSTTSTTTETIIREVFESSISKSTVTTETISICQSFISLYMKSEQWIEAITVSKRSLELLWKLIVTGRGTVALPRDFSSEAIEIAIRLAICHHRSNHYHEAEEIYLRVYRGCFSSCKIHDERFTKAYSCLVKFYEEHGHWDKVVRIYQEILVASRKHLGVSHALTIKFLYKLGSLCSSHGHGHAHEYYEEIITVLNGSSKVCRHDSFRAMEIMCRIYYEEAHWEKLRLNCEILWETWTHHQKEHKFEAKFIELLYLRYIYVLEHHFHVEYEIIRKLTIEFRETCVVVFGATSAITIRALIELAQISMRSEKYTHEAISHYEEVIKINQTTTKTTTETISTTTLTSVKEKLTKAYIQVCSRGSASASITERAISILFERFEYLKVTFGCAHTVTLTVLRELVQLYWKLKTKESITTVTEILLKTTILIISKESHSRTLFEAAKSIGAIYLSCGLIEEGRKLLHEMHRQIIFKIRSETCGFKIDHSIGRTSFVFLVTFEEILQGSVSISYSKIMADLLTETILLESYTRYMKSEKNIEVTLVAAAKFYVFLEKSSRKEQLTVLQEDVHKIFMKKWGSIIKTKQEISIVFVTNLLRILGTETRKTQIGDAACKSSNDIVRKLLLAGEINKAYEVASCAFQFAEHQGTYHHLQNVGYGFKLSALMACRGLKQSEKPIDTDLHTKMLDLSRKIITVVLKACKDSKINFVRMKLGELNDLVGLLGEQKNYSDLEWILNSLWSSREVQKQWSPQTIVSLAQLLIQSRFLLGQHASAVKLGEAICYNLRRVYGSLDPKALNMSDLLSRIYIADGHYTEAMRLHEEILRLVVEGDDADDRTLDTVTSERAAKEVMMLKQCFLRLKGWDKKPEVYEELVDQLLAMPVYRNDAAFKSVRSFDTWSLKEKPEGSREFKSVAEWSLVEVQSEGDMGRVMSGKNPRLGLKRITSKWGMNVQLLQGDEHQNGLASRLDVKPDIVVRAKETEIAPRKGYLLV